MAAPPIMAAKKFTKLLNQKSTKNWGTTMQKQQLYQVTATDTQWNYIEEACFLLSMVQMGLPVFIVNYIPFDREYLKDGLFAIHENFTKKYEKQVNREIKGTNPTQYVSDIAMSLCVGLKHRNEKDNAKVLDTAGYPTITLSEEQLNTIATACELIGRLMLGQADRIGILIPFDDYQLGFEFDEINHRYLQAYRDYVTIERDEDGNRKADVPLDIWRKIARKDDFRMGSEPSISVVGVVSE